MKQITLENFDQTAFVDPILTSPRSIAACQRLGIIPFDLIQKSVPLLKLVYPDLKLDNEGWQQKEQHDENRRIQKLRMALYERAIMIDNEQNGAQTEQYQQITQDNASTMIENERRQLQKIKNRQQKELKQMIDHEVKIQQMIERQNEKQVKLQEREYMRQMLLQQKRDQQEYERILREQLKQKKQKDDDYNQRLLAQEQYNKGQEIERIEELNHIQQEKERRLRDEDRKQQQLAFQQQTLQIQLKQEQEIQYNRQVMEQKQEIRNQILAAQKQQRQEAQFQAQQILGQKIMMAKYKNQLELERVREDFERKQQITEMKRQQFLADKQNQLQEASRIQGEHHQQIQQVIERNAAQEEYKKLEYLGKQYEAEQRKQMIDQNSQAQFLVKKQQEVEHENFRQQVRLNNQILQNKRIDSYRLKQMKKDQDLQMIQELKRVELRQRGNNEIIKQQDKKDNVNRILRMQEYQRDQLKQKIDQKMYKAEEVQNEKQILLEQRFQLKREVEMQKQLMFEEFERAKKTGKLSPQTISQMAASNHQQTNQSQPQESSQKKRPQSAKAYYPPKPKTPKKRPLIQSAIQQDMIQQDMIQQNGTQQSVTQQPNKFMKKQLDHLKVRQNSEMIKLLKNEQQNEDQREQVLVSIDSMDEQLRLETIFGLERAKAQAKIQKLQDEHQQQLQNFIQQ